MGYVCAVHIRIVVYSDASGSEGHLGAAVAALDNSPEAIESQQVQVGPMDRWSVHVAELIGIFYAVSTVFKISHQRPRAEQNQTRTATILCDSRSALQAIQKPGNKSGQHIIHAILQAATDVQAKGIALRLHWVPGHCDNPGNDAADRLAKEAASSGKIHPFRPLLTRTKALTRDNIRAQWKRE
jgi:ribonuclease HI